jgi:hypothetical protein
MYLGTAVFAARGVSLKVRTAVLLMPLAVIVPWFAFSISMGYRRRTFVDVAVGRRGASIACPDRHAGASRAAHAGPMGAVVPAFAVACALMAWQRDGDAASLLLGGAVSTAGRLHGRLPLQFLERRRRARAHVHRSDIDVAGVRSAHLYCVSRVAVIHIITPEYLPERGGVGDYTRAVARGLTDAGEIVHVWCSGAGRGEPGDRFTVHPDFGQFRAGDLRCVGIALDGFPCRDGCSCSAPHGFDTGR